MNRSRFIDTWLAYLDMKDRKGDFKVSLFLMRAVLRRLKEMESADPGEEEIKEDKK